MTVQTLAIVVLLVSFFVMIFLRFPIAYAVGLSSVFCMLVQGQALTDVCRLMVKGISSFSLMAVPFFITMSQNRCRQVHAGLDFLLVGCASRRCRR